MSMTTPTAREPNTHAGKRLANTAKGGTFHSLAVNGWACGVDEPPSKAIGEDLEAWDGIQDVVEGRIHMYGFTEGNPFGPVGSGSLGI